MKYSVAAMSFAKREDEIGDESGVCRTEGDKERSEGWLNAEEVNE